MNKLQLIIIAGAIALVIFLYNLPKVIINNTDKQALAGSGRGAEKVFSSGEQAHEAPVSKEDVRQIDSLRNLYNTASGKEKKHTFANSLAEKFENLSKFDSSIKYREVVVGLSPTNINLLKAAETCMNACGFAVNKEVAASFSQKAKDLFQAYLDKNPGDLEVKAKYAMTYVYSETPMQGIMILREVLEKNPENVTAIFNLGVLSMQSGQFAKATERFSKLVKLDSANWKARFYLGVSYLETGKKQLAVKEFELVEANEPDPLVQANVKGYLKELNN